MRTPRLLDIAADAAFDRIALGARAEGFDFEAYRARASQVAGWLRGRGKTNTAFLGMNGDVLPVLLFASGMAGTPFVPLNRSEEHTSELQSLMRNSYAVVCLKKQ